MKVIQGPTSNPIKNTNPEELMNEKERLTYINTLTLKDCLSILALSAPDLLEQVAAYVCQDPASPAALTKARAAVVEAMERESRPN